MAISYHNGDLLTSGCNVICHQVNLQGVMGGGIALQIAKKYPQVEEKYKSFFAENKTTNKLLGEVLVCWVEESPHWQDYKTHIIAHCFSQKSNFDTDYGSVKKCFEKIKECIKFELRYWFLHKQQVTIGVPYNYGCGIANGDWNKVENIFKEIFEDEESIDFQIWKL